MACDAAAAKRFGRQTPSVAQRRQNSGLRRVRSNGRRRLDQRRGVAPGRGVARAARSVAASGGRRVRRCLTVTCSSWGTRRGLSWLLICKCFFCSLRTRYPATFKKIIRVFVDSASMASHPEARYLAVDSFRRSRSLSRGPRRFVNTWSPLGPVRVPPLSACAGLLRAPSTLRRRTHSWCATHAPQGDPGAALGPVAAPAT